MTDIVWTMTDVTVTDVVLTMTDGRANDIVLMVTDVTLKIMGLTMTDVTINDIVMMMSGTTREVTVAKEIIESVRKGEKDIQMKREVQGDLHRSQVKRGWIPLPLLSEKHPWERITLIAHIITA